MGTVGVWAHWPAALAKASAHRHGAAPSSDGTIAPTRDAGPDRPQAQPPAQTGRAADDARLVDCPGDCPGSDDGAPPYCPVAMAANAFSKVIGYFHSSSGSSH